LIIDDYGHWGGSRKAVDEYFANRRRPFLQYIDQSARIGIKMS
jgi:O-methyltransferase